MVNAHITFTHRRAEDLQEAWMLAETFSACVAPTVHGATASDVALYLTPAVRDSVVEAFKVRVAEHKEANTTTAPALRVHTLGKRKPR